MLALLRMNRVCLHITKDKPNLTPTDWVGREDMLLGVLKMYTQKDVWTTVSDNTKFSTCKLKWEELKRVYRGVGSMSTFNTWVALTRMALDDSQPLLPQLQKLNDAHMTLKNNDIMITDLQCCFILIKALPNSYSTVTSTILATGTPSALSHRPSRNAFSMRKVNSPVHPLHLTRCLPSKGTPISLATTAKSLVTKAVSAKRKSGMKRPKRRASRRRGIVLRRLLQRQSMHT
jgi:gag-polypeptide of LTR copia-type